jgi:hypothetical protein
MTLTCMLTSVLHSVVAWRAGERLVSLILLPLQGAHTQLTWLLFAALL